MMTPGTEAVLEGWLPVLVSRHHAGSAAIGIAAGFDAHL